jgi:hypothetical protein
MGFDSNQRQRIVSPTMPRLSVMSTKPGQCLTVAVCLIGERLVCEAYCSRPYSSEVKNA